MDKLVKAGKSAAAEAAKAVEKYRAAADPEKKAGYKAENKAGNQVGSKIRGKTRDKNEKKHRHE